ncbi:gliding motility-associated C-terminal domain-containing protein [Membranicola marinus]|uniref:Gliding motility-associated C-terminal domain-containing protein n=1 Tax=Membranihabitans marinus TaxID=1227546 RepID=A0A953HSS8_9BACT|nr:gliding motility-associated C-terminal domain-containing protein [Membranihabitans marinus]MBY5957740.1 gliding motility-associated C-terminal domain-containing protein [Membranihabitans marinus]
MRTTFTVLLWCFLSIPSLTQELYQDYWGDRDILSRTHAELIRFNPVNGPIDTLIIPIPVKNRLPALFDVSFHPNGKLYAATGFDLIEIDLKNKTSKWLAQWYEEDFIPYPIECVYSDEKGRIMTNGTAFSHSYDYFTKEFISQPQLISHNSWLLFSFYKKGLFLQIGSDKRSIEIYDPISYETERLYVYESVVPGTIYVTKYFDKEYNLHLISNAYTNHAEASYFLDVNLTTKSISRINSKVASPLNITGNIGRLHQNDSGTPKDFRHNGYVLNLDADRSSGHYTGGFYDTLGICDPVASIADEDIDFDLDDQKIDSITFQFIGPKPGIISEEALEYSSPEIEKINKKRWIWKNNSPIRNYPEVENLLHDITYTAEWDTDFPAERIIGVNTYMNGDSTVSWSVIQLTGKESMAGNDVYTLLCDVGKPIDLSLLMDSKVSKAGYFSPALTGQNHFFDPDTDQEGSYLYIVEGPQCSDTAYWDIKLDRIEAPHIRDTMVCQKEEEVDFTVDPAMYDSIRWSDQSDQSVFTVKDTGTHWLHVWKGKCSAIDTFQVRENRVDNIVYDLIPDSISACQGDPIRWDLSAYDLVSMQVDNQPYDNFTVNEHLPEGRYKTILKKGNCSDSGWIQVDYIDPKINTDLPADTTLCSKEEFIVDLGIYSDHVTWADGFPYDQRVFRHSGSYAYSINRKGCIARDTIVVNMTSDCTECKVRFPNAITPNNDGHNDSFQVFAQGCQAIDRILIFDKWGNLLINYQGQEVPAARFDDLPAGQYGVVIEATDRYGTKITETSTLQILR